MNNIKQIHHNPIYDYNEYGAKTLEQLQAIISEIRDIGYDKTIHYRIRKDGEGKDMFVVYMPSVNKEYSKTLETIKEFINKLIKN